MKSNRWLLPEGIEEALPDQARQLEMLRRRSLDLFASWGYDLVMPPFIEYLESLLTGTGNDLDLQTFKLTDQMTGRMMGIRADMTPQVARIDTHHLKTVEPSRLCYNGTVLHTRPSGFAGSRSLLQVGAELFGHSGIESDVEVLHLMVETLRQAGVTEIYLDLGHVGVYRGLVGQAGLDAEQEASLFDALQRKANPEIAELLNAWSLDKMLAEMLTALTDLNGDDKVLKEAQVVLKQANNSVRQSLDNLQQITSLLQQRLPDLKLHFDLAELRGYHYHTGAVFAAYVPGRGQAIAQGGRYDGIGQAFGQARPATGFSTDLRTLAMLTQQTFERKPGIMAPAKGDASLYAAIDKLRAAGERVLFELPGQQGEAQTLSCDRQLVKTNKGWEVKSL